MLRITRPNGYKMLWYLLFTRDQGISVRAMRDWIVQNWYQGEEGNDGRVDQNGNLVGSKDQRVVRMASRLVHSGEINQREDNPLDPVITSLVEQLECELGGDPAPLLDRVAEILQEPFGRNMMSRETFQMLQKAILLPSEIRAAKERLDQATRHCPSCNHRFIEGELVTHHAAAMFCSRCVPPSTQACSAPECNEQSQIPDGLIRRFQKSLCHAHQVSKKTGEPVKVEESTTLPDVQFTLDAGEAPAQAVRRWATRNRPNPFAADFGGVRVEPPTRLRDIQEVVDRAAEGPRPTGIMPVAWTELPRPDPIREEDF